MLRFNLRTLFTAIFMVAALAFGLSAISDHFGGEVAGAIFVVLLFIGLPQVSLKLGVASGPILTDERQGEFLYLPMAATTKIFAGVIVAIDASGRAVNGADTVGLRVVGRAEETVDNSSGGNGDLFINVKKGVFKWPNSATNVITAAYIGKQAYVEDNQTVAFTTTHNVAAGRIIAVESDGVFVDTRHKAVAAALVATSTDGTAAAASANLANLAAEAEKIGDDVRAVIGALNG